MINQPLLDFIKQQLQVGSNKEKISNDLLTNGWTLQDIEEGFRATLPPTITPPVSPYAGASYVQNTDPIKTAETQQQTFQPQVQEKPVQQTQTSNIGEVHPFIKYGLIMGIVGIIFSVVSFLLSSIKNISGNILIYLVLFEIAISLISVFCIMLVAKMLKCNNRTFKKALSAVGVMGFLGGLVYLITFLELPNFILLILGLAGLIFTFFFLKKIYYISYLRAFSLWLLYGLFTSIIALIIFFAVGFSFLFSLFNTLQNQNPVNDINPIQQVSPAQDQTQQTEQNDTPQTINKICNNNMEEIQSYLGGEVFSCGNYYKVVPSINLADAQIIVFAKNGAIVARCGGLPLPPNSTYKFPIECSLLNSICETKAVCTIK